MKRESLGMDAIFNPRSVGVIGASDNPGKLGFHVMESLIRGGYPGRIFPVNPGKDKILGIKAYSSLLRVPETIDLCVVLLPAELVPKTITECKEKGVRGIVLITAGFKEIEDKRGEALQREVTELADRFRIKIIGPNTFGLVNLHLPLNASFTPELSRVKKGGISLISQSGGMSHLIAYLSMKNGIGLGKIIGLGNRCNVDFGDMAEYLIEDPETKVIAMYIEGMDHPRKLIEVAKRGGGKKPILAYKAGRFRTGDKASQFHTGSLAGKNEIYEGAFRQAGIQMMGSLEELLDASKALVMCPFLEGNRVAVFSGQAGPAIAACDVCEMEGLSIAPFSGETQKRIEELLPPLSMRSNPLDMGPAWYNSGTIQDIVQAVLEDGDIDAALLCTVYGPANRSIVGTLASLLLERKTSKPILCCFSSPEGIWEKEIQTLEESGIPNYPTPERAAKALATLLRFKKIRIMGDPLNT